MGLGMRMARGLALCCVLLGGLLFGVAAVAVASADVAVAQTVNSIIVEGNRRVAATYPANPNGSPDGITSVCNADGRVTILMPHPERTVHGVTGSWWPNREAAKTPWFQMFVNARKWVG